MLLVPLEGNRQHLHCTLPGKYLLFIIDTCIICNSCKIHFSANLLLRTLLLFRDTFVHFQGMYNTDLHQ